MPHARQRSRWWPVLALFVTLFAMKATAAMPHGRTALQCQVLAPRLPLAAGGPVVLRFVVHNTGRASLRFLAWNTPFEGEWFGPYLSVSRDGQALAYQGASVKRGDPEPDDYVLIGAQRNRHARADVSQAFDMSRPGHYVVEPHLQLHDVMPAASGRARQRSSHQPQALECNALAFDLH
jgi:hypothetical protein